MTRAQVQWRVRTGVWVPVAGDALRLASWPADAETELAAMRLTWPDAVLALGSAARLHRLPVAHDGWVHALVPDGRKPSRGLRPHRLALDAHDVETFRRGRVTTRRRTIVDCLGRLSDPEATRLLAWVQSRRLLDPADLDSWLGEHPKRWGNVARRAAVGRLTSGAVNPAEERLHSILRRAGIDGWAGGRPLLAEIGVAAVADVYFPDERLVLEVDGREAHAGRFQEDRTRQNALIAAGCTVLRYTWRDLVDRPAQVAAQVAATLRRLRAAPGADPGPGPGPVNASFSA